LSALLDRFDASDLAIATARIGAEGTITPSATGVGAVTADLDVDIDGLSHTDPALAETLGQAIGLVGRLDWSDGAPIRLSDIALSSGNVSVSGAVTADPGDGAVPLDFDIDAVVGNLARFATISGQDLSGALQASLTGTADPLSGAFDIALSGTGRDLRAAPSVPEGLLAGETRLDIEASRDTEGTRVEALRIDGTQVFVDMAGDLSSQGGGLRATARLADVGLILPELSGPATADATIASGEEGWNVVAAVTGPGGIDAQATALVGVSGGLLDIPSDGPLPVDFDIDASVADLAPFSPFAGQALSGALDAQLSGNADVRALTFDIALDGTARNLRAAPAVPNALLAGETRLVLQASNGADGLEIGRLTVDGTQITLDASGDLTTGGNGLSATARLANLGLLTDAIQGPASVTAEVARATQGWHIDANLRGPGGLTARTRGLVGLDGGRVDITATGSAPLALANRFIAPRSVNGQLSFDIAVRGQPGLGAVSGRFSTTGARVAAPTFRLAVENLGLDGSLSGGRVSFNGTGNVSSGGRLGLSGTVDAGGPGIPGSIDITLDSVQLVDPSLYTVLVSRADLSVTGPLAVAPRVGGRVDLGQSELRVPETGLGSAPPIPDIRHVGETAAERGTRAAAGLLARQSGGGGGSTSVGLDIDINAPGRIFLRGRGIDAEFGGSIRIAGNSAAIIPSGQFELIRGRISILGTRLDLTEARPRSRAISTRSCACVPKAGRAATGSSSPSMARPPPPISRSAPIPSCRKTRSSRSFSSGARFRPCRPSSFCNWPTPQALWPAEAPTAVSWRTSATVSASTIWTSRPTSRATRPCARAGTCRTTSTPMSRSVAVAKASCR
jgi:translocation and assembly module TamB